MVVVGFFDNWKCVSLIVMPLCRFIVEFNLRTVCPLSWDCPFPIAGLIFPGQWCLSMLVRFLVSLGFSNAIFVQYILECFGSGILSDCNLFNGYVPFFFKCGWSHGRQVLLLCFLFDLVFLNLSFCVRYGDRLLKVVLTLPVIPVLLFRFGGVMFRFTLYKIDFALSLSQNSNQLARLLCKYHFYINIHLISYFSVDVLS